MVVVYSSEISSVDNELVATIGFFDGVHLGHRFLIEQVKQKAREQNRRSAVITFRIHPRKVLHADFQPLLLNTFDEKIALLAATGIDYCIVLDFTVEMSELSAFQFLHEMLFERFAVRTLFVGHDHRFGHNRSEEFDDYRRYGKEIGMEILQVERFALPEYSHISSSEIRNSLLTGDVAKATTLLDYRYCFEGVVTDGFKIGRKIGFPTANVKLCDSEKLTPAAAVYAVNVRIAGVDYAGMMNIGVRPTVSDGLKTTLEVNIFDFNDDIYNQKISVCLVAKIRNEQKFNSMEELICQLEKDRATAIELLS